MIVFAVFEAHSLLVRFRQSCRYIPTCIHLFRTHESTNISHTDPAYGSRRRRCRREEALETFSFYGQAMVMAAAFTFLRFNFRNCKIPTFFKIHEPMGDGNGRHCLQWLKEMYETFHRKWVKNKYRRI